MIRTINYLKDRKTLNKKKKKIYFFGEKKSKFYIVNKETKKNKTILNVRYKEKLYKFKFKDFPFFQIENCLMAIFALVEAGFSINKLNLLLANIIESSICIVVGEHIKADEFLEIDSILLISLVIQVEYFLNFGFNLLLDRLTTTMTLFGFFL